MVGLGIMGCAGSIALAVFAGTRLPAELGHPTFLIALLLGVGTVGTLIALRWRHDRAGWWLVAGTWWSMALVGSVWLLPNADGYRAAHAAGKSLRAEASSGAAIVLFGYREPSIVYYVGRPTPTMSSAAELAAFLRERGSATTALRATDLAKLEKSGQFTVETRQTIEPRRIAGVPATSVMIARVGLRGTHANAASSEPERR
jgi:hypothetical protein